jgi:hypothetical protein
MISSATSVRGESRPEPEERKKRSTGEAGDGEGLKTVENRSVMKAPRIMQLIGRIRPQQKRRALERQLTSSSRKRWAGDETQMPKISNQTKMRTKQGET